MRITVRPSDGPASTYPVLSTPPLTCCTGPNCVPAGCVAARAARELSNNGSGVAATAPAAATPRNRHRFWLTSPCGLLVPTVEAPSSCRSTVSTTVVPTAARRPRQHPWSAPWSRAAGSGSGAKCHDRVQRGHPPRLRPRNRPGLPESHPLRWRQQHVAVKPPSSARQLGAVGGQRLGGSAASPDAEFAEDPAQVLEVRALRNSCRIRILMRTVRRRCALSAQIRPLSEITVATESDR